MEKNNLENYLRDHVKTTEEPPRPQLWEQLSERINVQSKPAVNTPAAKRVSFPFWKWGVAALLCGVLLSTFVWQMEQSNDLLLENNTKTTDRSLPLIPAEVVDSEEIIISKPPSFEATEGKLSFQTSSKEKNQALMIVALAAQDPAKAPSTPSTPSNSYDPLNKGALSEEKPQSISLETEVAALLDNALNSLNERPTKALGAARKLLTTPSDLEIITANELLFEVENELNTSFRSKVIQELKQNAVRLSQSMAQRSN